MNQVVEQITQRLQSLHPQLLEIEDDSDKHAGHAGNTGGGHYTIRIVSSAFENQPLLKRHRLVYDQVGDLMKTQIHALSIQAQTPAEHQH